MYLVQGGGEAAPEFQVAETWRLQATMADHQADFLLPRQFPDLDRNDLFVGLPLACEGVAMVVMNGRQLSPRLYEPVVNLDDIRRTKSESMRVVFNSYADASTASYVHDRVEAAVAVAAKYGGAQFLEVIEAARKPRLLDLKKILHWT